MFKNKNFNGGDFDDFFLLKIPCVTVRAIFYCQNYTFDTVGPVESLINKRCKGQQHMRWSREGLHALLQLRAAVNSNDWNDICERHIEEAVYHKTA